MEKIRGIVVPIATPVDQEERLDEDGLRKLTRYLVKNGVHGILANGSMSGFVHLNDDEQMRGLEIVLDEVGGKIPVIVNVGEHTTRKALRKARMFESLGPSYLAFLPPHFFLLSQPELRQFCEHLINGVQTPVFLYNNPTFTKNDLAFDTIASLSEHPNLAGVKESKQDFDKWLRVVRLFRRSPCSVLVGTEFLGYAALSMGCDGVIAGLHNVCPQVAVQMFHAVQESNWRLAEELQEQLRRLYSIFSEGDVWGGMEAALQQLAICEKVTVAPYRPVTEVTVLQRIHEVLEKYEVSAS